MQTKNGEMVGWVGWVLADFLLIILAAGAILGVAVFSAIQSGNPRVDSTDVKLKLSTDVAKVVEERDILISERDQLAQERKEWGKQQESLTAHAASLQETLRKQTESASKVIDQRILGISGNLKRVVFLVDMSASMAEEFTMQKPFEDIQIDAAWGSTLKRVKLYVTLLPVQEFRIVAFHHDLHQFPEEDKWLDRNSLSEAIAFLDSLKPSTTTNTTLALEKAYSWEPTTIILISDGMPSNSQGHPLPSAEQLVIVRQATSKRIPINSVAVGSYFRTDINATGFLKAIAKSSGGSFIGH